MNPRRLFPFQTSVEAQEPLRGELFSIEHLRTHAVQLAKTQTITRQPRSTRPFFDRFRENAQRLHEAHATIARAIHDGEPLTPDAEWLLDNFYVVQEHLHEIRDDLPPAYFHELPKLADGKPRIMQLAEELIVHTDSVIQHEDLIAFVNEYQSVASLTIGELWGLPIMLRLALVENLRRLADQLVAKLKDRETIRDCLQHWQPDCALPEPLHVEHPRSDWIAHAFTVQSDLFPDDLARGKALDQLLMERFPAATDVIRAEHRRQAANQVSIGNVITSMRLITALDWTAFFEQTSLVERMLRTDPAGIYPQMDAETRDRYRHVIEELAKRSRHSELNVTDRALSQAQSSRVAAADPPLRSHVGYWLIDDGCRVLEQDLNYRPGLLKGVQRGMRSHPAAAYFGTILAFLCCFLAAAGWLALRAHLSWTVIVPLLIAALIPFSELAVSLVNVLVTHLLPPRILPKLELKQGVPAACRTFVVVPAMLTGRKEVAALLDRLEMHYVGNPEPELRFALLTDFADAETENVETDTALVDQAVAGIRRLNAGYGKDGRGPFYLFHRSRQWNAAEGVWMGWERKRGKLMEFNQLLHGAKETSYAVQEGDLSVLSPSGNESAFPFIITLDADTQLPLGAARRLIGTLAHPLNRAQLSEREQCVTHGYTILQPRVSVQLQDGNKSRFAQLFANAKGIDPYATAASDVYQDLFDEGSFTGKGIYDVRAFERTLEDTFGENQILSHDLIEGCHARVGLASDIELIDGFPSRYDADSRRAHRWARGDWQILPWLFRHVPSAAGSRANRLSLLSHWKIFDNLRRSLLAPAICLMLIIAWYAAPRTAVWWGLVAFACAAWPLISSAINSLLGVPRPEFWIAYWRNAASELLHAAAQSLVLMACLPHKAYLMTDAIVRTLYRLCITRKRMLEWETAASTERRLAKSKWSIVQHMAFVPPLALVLAATISWPAWPAAAPWLVAWAISPWIAHFISQPFQIKVPELSSDDKQWLRLVARQTWSYFETHVGPKTNWLPPDNFQEYPEDKLAERISPTNEGLFLVSGLVARDFGFLGLHALLDLWEKNLAVWSRLPQWKGHFYNWYETATLQPLMPRYVSTVDSGNLAASLLVIRQASDDLCRSPVFGDAVWHGLRDTLEAAHQACEQLQPRGAHIVSPPLDDLTASVAQLKPLLREVPTTWSHRLQLLAELRAARDRLPAQLATLIAAQRHPTAVVQAKIQSLLLWIDGLETDLQQLAPWAELLVELQQLADKRQDSEAWRHFCQQAEAAQSLDELIALPNAVAEDLSPDGIASFTPEFLGKLAEFRTKLEAGSKAATQLKERCHAFGLQAERAALDMDFRFLFNPQRQLFAIGYNLEDGALDRSHYDMLCSEARLSSHLAIAKGDVASKHWFQLGRQATYTAGQSGLLSWGGTMFEFLMPLLFQKSFADSLLAQACETAVARQQEYGRQRHVPWGISESAFGALASNSDYCYQSFGVPGLGLKRGLSDDLVIAPYATMLALPLAPAASVANLRELLKEGCVGSLGFYDAIEYTPGRIPSGRRSWPVRCYMAHHQAMSLTAIANVLLDRIIERRFHAHPLIRATELLLQEAIPASAPMIQPDAEEAAEPQAATHDAVLVSRRMGFETPHPRTHLLSNGGYSVMVTNTGGGYSRSGELAIDRWRPDCVRDHGGQWIYIRDRRTNQTWSATYEPMCKAPDFYEATFSIDKAEYRRRDGDIETHLEVTVSPDNNVELRQLKLTNHGWRPCELEVTSYVEVTLATPAADLAHPAFQKLFVETEYVAGENALLAKRRPRESHQPTVWGVHVLAAATGSPDSVQFETSREKFIGRGRDLGSPAALEPGARLSGSTGIVLDPVFSLRTTVVVGRHASTTVAFTTGLTDSREEAMQLADQFHELRSVHRAFEMAWVFHQVQLRHLQLTAADAQRFQQLASLLLYPHASVRGPELALQKNRQGQSALWRFGISGDRPILLVVVSETEQVEFVRELMRAHQYWRHLGMDVDLVLLNTHPGSYLDELQEQLQRAVQEAPHVSAEAKTSIFLLRAAQMPREDVWLLEAAAQVVIDARRGWSVIRPAAVQAPPKRPARAELPPRTASAISPRLESNRNNGLPTGSRVPLLDGAGLEFWNGVGGFAAQGREYHMRLTPESRPPAPWSNVIANPRFGTLLTDAGGGYTWAGNSRQNKLTTWSNDPVIDPPSEALFLRDDKSGDVGQPLLHPRKSGEESWVQHGQGFTRFRRIWRELDVETIVSIAPDDPVKFVCVTIQNLAAEARPLTATYYAEWVLGVCREQTQLHLVTDWSQETGALMVRNAFHPYGADQVAFLKMLGPEVSATGDRVEFWGRNGRRQEPAALQQSRLSGKAGAGLDPCGAVQSRLVLRRGEKKEIVFLLGCGNDAVETHRLLERYQTSQAVYAAIEETVKRWGTWLTTVQVKTPNPAFDLLINRWLLYQVTSCRLWGRSAFYQSGGAYGFRDQLQDVMALVYARPDLAREQLLRAAARQFEEGDVQHWWHPPLGEGTRTRFSDDLLWLPFAATHYVRITGDDQVWDETASYLHSSVLADHEQERYELPQISSERSSLYEHCLRAVRHAMKFGEHGLPLIGCGDWNDGMNLVGAQGRGESVWVGWFLLVLLDQFIPEMERRGDHSATEEFRKTADELRAALERHAWDGNWYRRAFFDDGTPLGSQQNDECQIDSIVQSWAVLAGADADRAAQGLEAVFARLVSAEHRLVTLFAPPFDKTALDPGYIKGYLPGVRENGGQYTHAVAWLIQALTVQGDGERAMTIFDDVNPILHARTPSEVQEYGVEPYVVAADVYSMPPHAGRGGWSWYTGSASWMYRVALESILGMTLRDKELRFQPCVPSDWNEFEVAIRVGSTPWRFTVILGDDAGASSEEDVWTLVDDGREHHEVVRIRRQAHDAGQTAAMTSTGSA